MSTTTSTKSITRLPSLFLIGDSISIGYHKYLQMVWHDKYEYSRKTGNERFLTSYAIRPDANGDNSKMVRKYFSAIEENSHFDIVLANCGLHDIKRDPLTNEYEVEIDEYRENLKEIVRIGKKIGTKFFWISTTPVDEDTHNSLQRFIFRYEADVEEYNGAAEEIMKKNDVPILDLHSFTTRLGDDLYSDHVHFKHDIQENQAVYIAGWVEGIMRA